MLVDDQGNRSPVKVVAFTTPDNTVPAFGQGYPYMSRVTRSDCSRRHLAMLAWWPDSSTGGTSTPFHTAGWLYWGYSNRPL